MNSSSERPPRNGNELRDYRISRIEDAVAGHAERLKMLEDFVIRTNSSGITWKHVTAALVGLGTVGLAMLQLLHLKL